MSNRTYALPRLRFARRAKPEEWLVPWWVPLLLLLFAGALAPWIVLLVVTLPSQQVVAHWEIAWGGFDLGLCVLLAATAVSLARRSPLSEIFAAMTAAFLVCDAWFDVLTSRGTTTVVVAVLEALLVELPLAVVCLWIARNVERVIADARPFLQRAGFRIERRRLVPPDYCS